MKALAHIAALAIAASFAMLACGEAEAPEAFTGVRIGKPTKSASSKDDDDDKKTDSKTTTSTSTTTTTPASTTPATPAAPAVPACTGKATFNECVSCCDPTNVYPAFLAKWNACASDDTACKNAASQTCFNDKACSDADKCLLPNKCWDLLPPDPE